MRQSLWPSRQSTSTFNGGMIGEGFLSSRLKGTNSTGESYFARNVRFVELEPAPVGSDFHSTVSVRSSPGSCIHRLMGDLGKGKRHARQSLIARTPIDPQSVIALHGMAPRNVIPQPCSRGGTACHRGCRGDLTRNPMISCHRVSISIP